MIIDYIKAVVIMMIIWLMLELAIYIDKRGRK